MADILRSEQDLVRCGRLQMPAFARIRQRWIPLFLLRLRLLRRPVALLAIFAPPLFLSFLALTEATNLQPPPTTGDLLIDSLLTSLFLVNYEFTWQIGITSIILVDVLRNESKINCERTLVSTAPVHPIDFLVVDLVLGLIVAELQLNLLGSVLVFGNGFVEKDLAVMATTYWTLSLGLAVLSLFLVAVVLFIAEVVPYPIHYAIAPALLFSWSFLTQPFIGDEPSWLMFFQPIILIIYVTSIMIGSSGDTLLTSIYRWIRDPTQYIATAYSVFVGVIVLLLVLTFVIRWLRRPLSLEGMSGKKANYLSR